MDILVGASVLAVVGVIVRTGASVLGGPREGGGVVGAGVVTTGMVGAGVLVTGIIRSKRVQDSRAFNNVNKNGQ